MHGDLWLPARSLPEIAAWIDISADALDRAPTVTVVTVTHRPPTSEASWPVAIPLPPGLLPTAAWARTTQIHTLMRTELDRRVGRLPDPMLRQLNDALLRVLGLGSVAS